MGTVHHNMSHTADNPGVRTLYSALLPLVMLLASGRFVGKKPEHNPGDDGNYRVQKLVSGDLKGSDGKGEEQRGQPFLQTEEKSQARCSGGGVGRAGEKEQRIVGKSLCIGGYCQRAQIQGGFIISK